MDTAGLNPFAPEFLEDPYPVYRRLRDADPVHRTPAGTWVLSRHADVAELLRDLRFSNDFTKAGDGRPASALIERPADAVSMVRGQIMLFVDPPDHTRLRTLVNKAFTARAIEAMRPRVQEIVDALVDRVAGEGSMDVVSDLAFPLPVIVICEMLGVPTDHHERFEGLSSAIATMLDPMASVEEARERLDGAAPAAMELGMYFGQLIGERRSRPRDDLLSALIAAEQDGDRLSAPELMGMCILLFVAGHETTMNLIGNGTLALLRHRDQLDRLRDDPSLARSAVDELLRYDSPVQLTARTALEDLDLAGVTVRRGEQVIALIGAANRDPAVFDDPDALDIGRQDNRHLSFGGGHHFCLGAPLARLEGQVAFATMARRLRDIDLADEPVHRDTFTLRGLRGLRMRFAA